MKQTLDMLCGFGGWTAGAERTGRVRAALGVNHLPAATDAFQRAHPHAQTATQDVLELPWRVLQSLGIDWALASPVCKDFSTCGKPAAKGTGGNGTVRLDELLDSRRAARNTSHAVTSMAEALRPDVILVENVPGFLDWELFPHWAGMLETLGYTVREHVINAADYGAAVDRPRAIVTAAQGRAIELATSYGDERTTMADCLDPVDHPGNRWYPIDSKPDRTRKLIRSKQEQYGLARGVINNVGDGVRMRRLDELAPSFTTKTGSQLMIVDEDRVRIVNPRELGRMAGFTDSELDALPKKRGECSLLLGNVISPALSEGIARQALAA